MQPVLTPAASARLDAASSDPGPVLMERAGLGVALAAVRMGARYGARAIVLAGPGNNGGDGYVAARYLHRRGVAVQVHALAEPKTPDAEWAHAGAVDEGVSVRSIGVPQPADLIIDAVFGAGFRGSLPDVLIPWTETDMPVLAVDIPSGLDGTTGRVEGSVFTATTTVTFHSPKVGQIIGRGPDVCGRLEVRDIGLVGGDATFLLTEESDAPRPERARTAHKWSAGSVLVVGGSPGMTGAPLLAARSALHAGAGSVSIACPGALQTVYAGAAPELLTTGIGSGVRFEQADAQTVAAAAERFDLIALGPGLGRGREGFVTSLLEAWDGPLLIDADGINALSGPEALAERPSPTVITPHVGEFRRLTNMDATYEHAAELAAAAGTVVVLKGSPTFVMGAERWVVTSGGPELATIGTGDVLTGLLAALWARGLDAETAARSAAYWHGRAGARLGARETVTADLLATEVGKIAW
ncbi:MAG: NAD(P)H-hydrate dehydratase [Actinobacteria bacterium]|nr:NAD(P)H-hydrate dehydratase [Actinomycetota bacterium]